jgi:L-alanine-DL-glutamate epimerase-like enolase superfamily enzyme
MSDAISWVRVSACTLPLANPISDAKVLTGRQKPMTEIAILFVEIKTKDGAEGVGFSYSKRAGGPGQFAHAKEIAPVLIGEDPSDIAKLWDKLCWAGASVGRSGLSVQAIGAFDVALWDLKAKRAGLSLAKLLGTHRDSVRCYNTSGGFLHTPLDQLLVNASASVAKGIGGIKLKVGQPDCDKDIERVSAVRQHLGERFPIMVDANQQWDRPTAQRMCRRLEPMNLVWIEEPLDAYDHEGHAALAAQFDTPIATGEMLHQRAGTLGSDSPPRRRLPDARWPSRGRHHAFPQDRPAGRTRGRHAGPALCDGVAHPPGRHLQDRTLGRAL